MARGFPYMLIPSLDGSLYLLNVESSALTSIPITTDVYLFIGDDEIAGGSFVSSTGIDPLTGKVGRKQSFHLTCFIKLVTTNLNK